MNGYRKSFAIGFVQGSAVMFGMLATSFAFGVFVTSSIKKLNVQTTKFNDGSQKLHGL